MWRGALLLADYILSNPDIFKNKVVLELGAGVGLTSIVVGFFAKEVICTGNKRSHFYHENCILFICIKY